MAEIVPAITLTDPHNEDSAPSRFRSPKKASTPLRSAASDRPMSPALQASPRLNHGTGSTAVDDSQGARPQSGAPMDSLSQYLSTRLNTPLASPDTKGRTTRASGSPQRNRRGSSDHSPAPAVQQPSAPPRSETSETASKDFKRGVKGVSFLNRFIGNKKRDEGNVVVDDETTSNDGRPEGNEAEVFAEAVDNTGYGAQHPHPPSYIKTRMKNKKTRDFDRLFFAQELECRKRRDVESNGRKKLRRKSSSTPDGAPVWAMRFSKDGKYLAAAGADTIVRVWAVISSPEERAQHERDETSDNVENGNGSVGAHLSAPVFQSRPIREYDGHTDTVLDLSWSKNNFLLSSSMDKTVRLWHVSRSECLCTFKHSDVVPSISFHPKDDRFFLAGSLDSRLRLWSIPDKSVAFSAAVPDLITAVALTPDGKHAVAGCLGGLCMFFETEGMKYQSQINVRLSRGQNAKSSKITGIQSYLSPTGATKLLITSNDSRVRVYNFRDKSLELKLKGNENNSSQIHATLSDDAQYVICGSEDRRAHIWSLGPAEGEKRDKVPLETFGAHNTVTTTACFAPANTRHLLSRSQDPIYDLCHPPPVTLTRRAERAGSRCSSKPPTEAGSIPSTPADIESSFEKQNESHVHAARSAHEDGNIIVTADFMGQIKVFRQDCAWAKRRLEESDRSSLFMKRNGRISRPGSLHTKASLRSIPDAQPPPATQVQADLILSWRQGIASTSNLLDGTPRSSALKFASQSNSPHQVNGVKSMSTPRTDDVSDIPPDARSTHSLSADALSHHADRSVPPPDTQVSSQPTVTKSPRDNNPLMLKGGQSYMFWNTADWKEQADRVHQRHDAQRHGERLTTIMSRDDPDDHDHLAVRPSIQRGDTYVSQLSDERDTEDEFDDAKESHEDMTCRKCGGLSFSAKTGREGTRLVCSQCGLHA